MYIEKKKIGKRVYNYLKASFRVNNKVKTKTIAYLGKEPMSKKEIEKKIAKIPKSKIEELKKDFNQEFLKKEQIKELNTIKKDFSKKIKNLNKELLNDMFKDFKTYYIYNTNSIEGNTITLQETNLLLNENKTPSGRDLREIYDHINAKDCFDYLLKNKPKINKELIIDIHSRLLKNIDKRIGYFRTHKVRVFGATFETTPPQYIEADMKILLRWYNRNRNKLHPIILSALFHEKFEKIHPFYDGNGRTGRMISNLILIQSNFPPLIIENKKRKKYYEVLSKGHEVDLDSIKTIQYKPIVKYFYKELLRTYETIFSKWG